MENLAPIIRNAVRAVVVRGERILLLKKNGGDRGERYALPGGAQELGETLHQALNRECREEIGSAVEIVDLLYVADFFRPRKTDPPSTRHLVEFLFQCTLPDGYVAQRGSKPDKSQVDVVWRDLADIEGMSMSPKALSHLLPALQRQRTGVYLGTLE